MQQMLLGLGAKDYEIERSLRFNDGDTAYLSRTLASSNRRTWTMSFWFKKGVLNIYQMALFHAGPDLNNTFGLEQLSNQFRIYDYSNGMDWSLTTDAYYRDPSAWYHLVLAVDTTQATASNRVKFYINGEQVTSFSTENYPSQNHQTYVNYDVVHYIGSYFAQYNYWDGYMAEFNFVDGQALLPSSFARTDSQTNQWIAKKYGGSYGTNGFYLNFSDNSGTSATTLGKDTSGQSNNFTPYNFVTGDSVKDTPTNNFTTWRMMGTPFSSGASFSQGNLSLTTGSTSSGRNLNRQAFAPFLVNSGKWYAEFVGTASDNANFVGVGPYQVRLSPTTNNTRYAYVYSDGDSYLRTAGSESIATYGAGIPVNNVIGVYLDMDAATPVVYFSSNGQWADGSGNFDESSPTAGLTLGDSFFTTDTGNWDGYGTFIASSAGGSYNMTIHANFGQDSTFAGLKTAGGNTDANGFGDFKYPVPTGALSMCSANLPDPTIKKSSKYFDIELYTGNGSTTQNIATGQFQPDWVWIKSRSSSGHHSLIDSVRGDIALNSNQNIDEYSVADFNINATSLDVPFFNNEYSMNTNGDTYVAWNWNAGGSTVTNNDGSVSSQVRASTTAGISIVTYTGTGSNITVGHGLGVTPDVHFIKSRSTSGNNWLVNFTLFDGTYDTMRLNGSNQRSNITAYNAPTSTVFSRPSSQDVNNEQMLAYCFASVKGFSKYGTYRGTANADGPYIHLGFKPALVIIKKINASGEWVMLDDTRDTSNVTKSFVFASEKTAESVGSGSTENYIDILANGFKIRDANNKTNASGKVMLYMAWAKSPFKYSRAR